MALGDRKSRSGLRSRTLNTRWISLPGPARQAGLTTEGFMAEYSKYQQKVIKRYYDNRDSIALQRVQELVTELYLASGK